MLLLLLLRHNVGPTLEYKLCTSFLYIHILKSLNFINILYLLNLCLRKEIIIYSILPFMMNFTSRNKVKFAVSFNFINKVKMKRNKNINFYENSMAIGFKVYINLIYLSYHILKYMFIIVYNLCISTKKSK